MIEDLATLMELQKIDDEVGKAHKLIGEREGKLARYRTSLDALAGDIRQESERIQELRKRQRTLEGEIEDSNALNKKTKDRLNSIKNSREFRALQKELEDRKRRVTEMEEELIQILEEAEEAEKGKAGLEEEFKNLDGIYQEEKAASDKEVKDGQSRLKSLEKKRDKIGKTLRREIYIKYQHTLMVMGGKAVVPVESSVCLGCNMNIPPQTYNELQRGEEVKFCPHCERFIFWQQT